MNQHISPANLTATPVQANSMNSVTGIDAVQLPLAQLLVVTEHSRCEFAGSMMTDLILKLTVKQLCAVIRQHGIEGESETMLGMLESLVIAGEIALPDFMERVQNLFPHIFTRIDRALLETLSAYAAD